MTDKVNKTYIWWSQNYHSSVYNSHLDENCIRATVIYSLVNLWLDPATGITTLQPDTTTFHSNHGLTSTYKTNTSLINITKTLARPHRITESVALDQGRSLWVLTETFSCRRHHIHLPRWHKNLWYHLHRWARDFATHTHPHLSRVQLLCLHSTVKLPSHPDLQ